MKTLPLLTIACVALGTAGLAVYQTQLPVTPVTTLRGKGVAPAVGTTRLYVTDADSTLWMYDRATKRTALVSRRGEFWDLTVSPTGDRIAFFRMSEDQSSWHIWSMPLDPKTGLAAGPARRASMSQGDVPSFSPDGKLIAFGRDDPVYRGGQVLTVVPATGGPERVLARLSGGIWNLDWTPDGKTIYVSTGHDGQAQPVQRVPSTGGQPEFVMETSVNGWLSPDGRLLLTTAGQGQGLRHVVSDPTGKKLGDFTLPARHVVLDWSGPTTVLTTMNSTPTSITTVSLADGRVRRLTDSTGDAVGPAWSPDGRRLAYHQWNGSKLDVVIVNADGTGKKVIPGNQGLVTVPEGRHFFWSPDGATILLPGKRDSTGQTFRIYDVITGREREVDAGRNLIGVDWMPDSRSILRAKLLDSTSAGRRFELHQLSLDGRDRVLREITSNCPPFPGNPGLIGDSLIVFGCLGGTAVAPLRDNSASRMLFPGDTTTPSYDSAISPDGQWLVFRVRVPQEGPFRAFDVLRVDGSSRHRIELSVSPLGGRDNPVITRDSRTLIFIGRDRSTREIGVYRVPLAGGEVTKLVTLRGATATTTNRDYSISRDGNAVTYVAHGQPTTMLGEINLARFLPPAPRR